MLGRHCEACGHPLRGDRDEITLGPLYLNLNLRAATLDGQLLHLPTLEFAVLELLVCRAGMPVPFDAFFASNVLKDEGCRGLVANYVCRVRRKLRHARPGFEPIKSLYGGGYMYEKPSVGLAT